MEIISARNADQAVESVLILTDGKIGDLVQCRGVAAHLAAPDRIRERVVTPSGWYALPLPFVGVPPHDRPGRADSLFDGPAPDVIIASGRRTLPYLRLFRKRRAGKRPLLVFLKDPRAGRGACDFVWAPVHDRLSGEDVIATDTSPHGLTAEVLKQARAAGEMAFADMPKPWTGVILGGVSGSVSWGKETVDDFARVLRDLPREGSILVTPSRRTPDNLGNAVQAALADRQAFYWTGAGDNPYLQILAISERLIVTGDSHNMVSECLATGIPTTVFRPENLQPKLHHFLDRLIERDLIADAASGDPAPAYSPVDATVEIADALRERLGRR